MAQLSPSLFQMLVILSPNLPAQFQVELRARVAYTINYSAWLRLKLNTKIKYSDLFETNRNTILKYSVAVKKTEQDLGLK